MANITIAEGLDLSEEWALINRYRIEKELESHDTVSDVLLICMESLREEEFGGDDKISSYEKKLVMVGFHLAQAIMQKQQEAAARALGDALEVLGSLRKDLEKEE